MKTVRALALFAPLAFVACLSAQTIQFISVVQKADFVQTGPSTVSADPTTPFVFKASVEGDHLTTNNNPLTAVTYTPQGGSVTPLSFNSNNHAWQFQDTTQTSMANLNTAYPIGTYGFNLTGTPSGSTSVNVASFAGTQLQTPQFTLSGGSWVGNTYVLTDTATLTVVFNPVYSGTVGGTAAFHFDAELNGSSYNVGNNDFVNYNPQTLAPATYASTPPNFVASALTAGSYSFSANYDDVQNPASVFSGVLSASLLEYQTTVNISVIPEPATYEAIFGAVALAGVMIHRRRRPA